MGGGGGGGGFVLDPEGVMYSLMCVCIPTRISKREGISKLTGNKYPRHSTNLTEAHQRRRCATLRFAVSTPLVKLGPSSLTQAAQATNNQR